MKYCNKVQIISYTTQPWLLTNTYYGTLSLSLLTICHPALDRNRPTTTSYSYNNLVD